MTNASVPAERLEKYHFNFSRWNGKERCQEISLPGEFYLASDVDALLAEAREEGKPIPEISEAQLYEAVRHKSIKDRMDAVSALFARVAPPASAGTEGPGLRKAMEAIHAKHYRGPLDFKDDRGVQVGVSMVKADIAKALAARPVKGGKK